MITLPVLPCKACPGGSKHCSNGKCVNNQYLCDGQVDTCVTCNKIFKVSPPDMNPGQLSSIEKSELEAVWRSRPYFDGGVSGYRYKYKNVKKITNLKISH